MIEARRLIKLLICVMFAWSLSVGLVSVGIAATIQANTLPVDKLSASAPELDILKVSGEGAAKAAAERATGGVAKGVSSSGNVFIVKIVKPGAVLSCTVDASTSRVLGCR